MEQNPFEMGYSLPLSQAYRFIWGESDGMGVRLRLCGILPTDSRLTVRHQVLDPPPVAMVRKREPFLTAICGPPLEHFYCLGREFEELVKNGQVCGFYENSAAPNRGTCLFWLASVERSYLCRKLIFSI